MACFTSSNTTNAGVNSSVFFISCKITKAGAYFASSNTTDTVKIFTFSNTTDAGAMFPHNNTRAFFSSPHILLQDSMCMAITIFNSLQCATTISTISVHIIASKCETGSVWPCNKVLLCNKDTFDERGTFCNLFCSFQA